MLTRDEAQALIQRVIAMSKAEGIQVSLSESREDNIRFAANQITTSGSVSDLVVRVHSTFGTRAATTTTNDISDAALERAVRLSETLARLAPENPEALPLLPAQQYPEVNGFVAATANATAEQRARAAGAAIAAARAGGDLSAAGLLLSTTSVSAIGNSSGLFAWRPGTEVDFSQTVRTADGTGSGWAGANHPDWNAVDLKSVSDIAIAKARLSRDPVRLEPGRYTVILEPQAAGDLVSLLAGAFDARAAEEGRSAFAKAGGGTRLGEKIVDERVTIISDPADPQLRSRPWDGEGFPLSRQSWISNGVLTTLASSRWWAQKQGRVATGSPDTLKMLGGNQALSDIIASTERGVLITRFWYIRPVNARTMLFTGLTRDGTFMVQDGKIAHSVSNMRFNESPLFMLDKLDAIGTPVRLSGQLVMPALRVRDFTFSSVSDAV